MTKQTTRVISVAAIIAAFVAACGCGGEPSPTGSTSGADAPWVGDWVAVSENGEAAEGTLSLSPTAFEQTYRFGGDSCTWTGAISDADAAVLTLTTETGTGGAGCSVAVGASATPTWETSGATLTLDYRDANPFGTLQVWERQ